MRNAHSGILVGLSLLALLGCSDDGDASTSRRSVSATCSAADDRVWLSGGPDGYEVPRLVVAGGGADPDGVIAPTWFTTYPSPSPDGQTVAVTRANSDYSSATPNTSIWTMRPDGSDRRAVTDCTADWQPDWSPDGATLVFSRHDPVDRGWRLTTMSATGGPATTLTDVEGVNDYTPKFSPDGSLIGFLRFEEISNDLHVSVWTIRPDGTNPTELAQLPVGNVGTMAWTPDGEHLVVGRHEGLSSVGLADGAVTVISNEAVAAAWSDDGQRMYVLVEDTKADGYTLASATQDEDGTVVIGKPIEVATSITDWTIALDGCPPQS